MNPIIDKLIGSLAMLALSGIERLLNGATTPPKPVTELDRGERLDTSSFPLPDYLRGQIDRANERALQDAQHDMLLEARRRLGP